MLLLISLCAARALSLSCRELPLSALPFCNSTLSVEQRVADLLPRLNQSEKVSQMGMVAAAVERLGMRQYNFGGEALHGVWANCVTDNVTTPSHNATGRQICPTQFPAPVHMSQAFDREMWAMMADASSAEARGLYHSNLVRHSESGGFGAPCARSLEGCLGLSYYTPNVNLARDPRWGRIEECPGEDPVVNAEYARAFTRGFQNGAGAGAGAEAQAEPYYIRASVTVKIRNVKIAISEGTRIFAELFAARSSGRRSAAGPSQSMQTGSTCRARGTVVCRGGAHREEEVQAP